MYLPLYYLCHIIISITQWKHSLALREMKGFLDITSCCFFFFFLAFVGRLQLPLGYIIKDENGGPHKTVG